MKPARKDGKRCQAQRVSQAERDRCILPFGVGGHEMAQSFKGFLALPVLIHRDAEGNEWTIHGMFVRQQEQETS